MFLDCISFIIVSCTLSIHLRHGLPHGLVPSISSLKILFSSLPSARQIYPIHSSLVLLTNWTTFSLLNSSLSSLFDFIFHFCSSWLYIRLCIFLSIFLSDLSSFSSSLFVVAPVAQKDWSYIATIYSCSFVFLDINFDLNRFARAKQHLFAAASLMFISPCMLFCSSNVTLKYLNSFICAIWLLLIVMSLRVPIVLSLPCISFFPC